MSISITGLTKTYNPSRSRPVAALDRIDLDVKEGELLVVVGPSGSGKTTLLRCIAGLEVPDEGRIEVQGREITKLLPGDRDVAMVFQEYALYPHLTVEANISFGLKARRVGSAEARTKTVAVAESLGLKDLLGRKPPELSGGERQRVALARAIVREPSAYLMDEPLGNLDAELRTKTRAEIRMLQRRLGTTTIYVTHDQVEAMTMGDRVVVLRGGRVQQIDTPAALYDHPANTFVASFFGNPPMNLYPAGLHRGPAGASFLGVRPEVVKLVAAGTGHMSGRVEMVETMGADAIVHVHVDGRALLAKTNRAEAPAHHEEVGIYFSEDDLYAFDANHDLLP